MCGSKFEGRSEGRNYEAEGRTPFFRTKTHFRAVLFTLQETFSLSNYSIDQKITKKKAYRLETDRLRPSTTTLRFGREKKKFAKKFLGE